MVHIKNEFTDSEIVLSNEDYAAIKAYVKKEEMSEFARQHLEGIIHRVSFSLYNKIQCVLNVRETLEDFAKNLERDTGDKLIANGCIRESYVRAYVDTLDMHYCECRIRIGKKEMSRLIMMTLNLAEKIQDRIDSERLDISLFDVNGSLVDTRHIDEIENIW